MKVTQNYDFLLGLLSLLIQNCWAQRSYNYVRPSSNVEGVGIAAGITNPLRPVVPALPISNAAAGARFSATPTAFAVPANANVGSSQATFGGFQGTLPANLVSNAPSFAIGGNFGAATSAGSQDRSSAQALQRQGAGIFGSNVARGQSSQFAGRTTGTATAIISDVNYEGDGDYSAIPGIAGVDYPIYSIVPQTSFDCSQQPLPGYYSDVEANCQVFHICALNRTFSFLCPNGTVFSQETLVCVWWNQYDCSLATTLYANNAFIYDYGKESPPALNYQENSAQLSTNIPSRPQAGFQITNTGRTVPALQSSGIFGSSSATRSSSFTTATTPLTPPPPTNYISGNIGSQTTGYATVAGQALPNTPLTSATIGNVARGGTDASAIRAGGVSLRQNEQQNAQLSTSSSNRDYLPPPRRT